MIEAEGIYLAKAEESLEGAESEFANGRYNNSANRCYYASFQAAIHALLADGAAGPARTSQAWRHAYVQAQFAGELINRRRRYSAELRSTLLDNLTLRQRADYEAQAVSEIQASRAVRRTRSFVAAVRSRGGERA